LTKYAIDNKAFHNKDAEITWEQCSLRKWLNSSFYNTAFNESDKNKIIMSKLVNDNNPEYGTSGGNETEDKIFILSAKEAKKYVKEESYFPPNKKTRPTPWAVKQGALKGTGGVLMSFLLRSPGHELDWVRTLWCSSADSSTLGTLVYASEPIRPALRYSVNNIENEKTYATVKFVKPPRLTINDISFINEDNTKILSDNSSSLISLKISNAKLGGTAYNLKALISAKDLSGKALQNVSFPAAKEIGNISPGKSVKVDIPITGGDNLASGTAAFTITFSEANGFEPDSKTIKIQTVKTDPPDVQLAEFGLDDTEGELSFGNGNGIVEPGESIVLNLALLNDGEGATKGTKITFESGDAEIHFIDNTQFSKGNIQPGGKVSLNTAFSISRRYKGSSTLPIKMKITDERKRFNKEIPLNIALKRSYPKTEIINIASNYKKPQKIKTQTDPLNNIPDAKTQNKYGVAVIIGVRNYENKVPPVLFAINDAQTVRDYVVKALGYNPDNIIYVENPTKGQMEENFGTDKTHKGRLFNYIKPDRSDVLVYYAGHGAPDQGTKTAFFVPKDANPDYIKIGGYSMETFYANLAKLPAKNITVLTDACFSGQTGDGRMIINHASPLAVSAKLPGTVNSKISVFNAGRDSEMASWYAEKQHGLFTYYFLLGLGGKADTNKDKTITAGEIDAYLQENVPGIARRLYNREQHPVFTGNRNATIAEYK
jgi:hypothetical protein